MIKSNISSHAVYHTIGHKVTDLFFCFSVFCWEKSFLLNSGQKKLELYLYFSIFFIKTNFSCNKITIFGISVKIASIHILFKEFRHLSFSRENFSYHISWKFEKNGDNRNDRTLHRSTLFCTLILNMINLLHENFLLVKKIQKYGYNSSSFCPEFSKRNFSQQRKEKQNNSL